MTKKQISWSYPSSPNAEKFGFSNGCYSVATVSSPNWIPRYFAGFKTFEEAKTFADTLEFEWSRYTLLKGYETHNPQSRTA